MRCSGAAFAANVTGEEFYLDLTARTAAAVLRRIDPGDRAICRPSTAKRRRERISST